MTKTSSSKQPLSDQRIRKAVAYILKHRKARKFVESVELQIALQDYNPQRDRRFFGRVELPYEIKNKTNIGIIGDYKHIEEAKNDHIDIKLFDEQSMRALNKNKKLIKKWQQSVKIIMASETLIRKIPQFIGPSLGKIGKFPNAAYHDKSLTSQVNSLKKELKFQLKKHTHLCQAIANLNMTEEQIAENVKVSIYFLASLTKKGWLNIKKIYLKTTMGTPLLLYGDNASRLF